MQDKRNNKDENGIENRKTTEKINETKCWFFQKINKIAKPLDRWIREKKET